MLWLFHFFLTKVTRLSSIFLLQKSTFFVVFYTFFWTKKPHQNLIGPDEREHNFFHLFFIIFSSFFTKKSSFLSTFSSKIDIKNYFFYLFYYLFSSFFVFFYTKNRIYFAQNCPQTLFCVLKLSAHNDFKNLIRARMLINII